MKSACPAMGVSHQASLGGCMNSTALHCMALGSSLKLRKEGLAPSQPYTSTADEEGSVCAYLTGMEDGHKWQGSAMI